MLTRLTTSFLLASKSSGKINTRAILLSSKALVETPTEERRILDNQLETIDNEEEIQRLDPFAPVKGQAQLSYLENLVPPLKKACNFAAYINQVKTLQNLLNIGVSLYDIENVYYEDGKYLIGMDFDNDCQKHLEFIISLGVEKEQIGRFITIFPKIFQESIENLQIRINFLESLGFKKRMITTMLNKNPLILSMPTKVLEEHVTNLKSVFKISDDIMREILVGHPEVALLPEEQYILVSCTLSDEFGFDPHEVKTMLRKEPSIIDMNRPALIKRLDFIHNKMGLSHELISYFPQIVTSPFTEMRHRYWFLRSLKKDQFNPKEPLYVPPSALYQPDDLEFCIKYAKSNFDEYKSFIRTL